MYLYIRMYVHTLYIHSPACMYMHVDITTPSGSLQATILLVCPKYTPADVKFASSIDLLNSKQIEVVLDNYRLCKGEPTLSPEFATHLITSAKMTRDKLLVRDKGRVTIEEDTNFNPFAVFVLPEMGYMGQVVQGVPQGLLDYTKPFVNMGQ